MPELVIPVALTLLTLTMMYVSGANDGGAILAMPTRVPGSNVLWFALILTGAIVVGPLLLTTVAQTLVGGLFDTSGAKGVPAFFIGSAVALFTVIMLTRFGLPTSLTLALVGGLTGAGLGAGMHVAWPGVTRVLLIGLAAPFVGYILAAIAHRLLAVLIAGPSGRKILTPLHTVAFGLVGIAYALNDGQKMFALAAVTWLAISPGVDIFDGANIALLIATGVVAAGMFLLGLFSKIRRVGVRLGLDLAKVRATDAITAQVGASVAVLASSMLGAPVSMTQSLSGGIVGATSVQGIHRVRWDSVLKIVGAWIITLPVAGIVSLLIAKVLV